MKLTIIALLLAMSCMGTAFAQDPPDMSERYADLEEDKSGFRETWVVPGADFTKYNKLYIWNAEFQFRDVGPARRTRSTFMSSRKTEFGISDKDREEFQKIISDAFLEEIQQARNFELVEVDGVDQDTLIMRGAVLDIISRVPPDTIGQSEIYLSSIGEATLVMELLDAGTGDVVALVAERRHLQRSGGIGMIPTSIPTIIADLRGWARRAAKTLRTELDNAIAGK